MKSTDVNGMAANDIEYLHFDSTRGRVETDDGERAVVMPWRSLEAFMSIASAASNVRALRAVGATFGRVVAHNAAGDVRELHPEEVFASMSRVCAMFGWGVLSWKQLHDAISLTLRGAVESEELFDAVGSVLEGMLRVLLDVEVACVRVGPGAAYLVVHPDAQAGVRELASRGNTIGEIAAALRM